jgi:hypothetical protein
MNNLIIKNIGKLYNPVLGKVGKFNISENCSLIISNGVFQEICTTEIEINAIRLENYKIIDAEGKTILPGFVDSHAHPIFAELRDKEFEMRNAGKSYLEIAEAGGGTPLVDSKWKIAPGQAAGAGMLYHFEGTFGLPEKDDLDNGIIGDPTKAKTQLGWKPKYDLAALVQDMVASDLKIFS